MLPLVIQTLTTHYMLHLLCTLSLLGFANLVREGATKELVMLWHIFSILAWVEYSKALQRLSHILARGVILIPQSPLGRVAAACIMIRGWLGAMLRRNRPALLIDDLVGAADWPRLWPRKPPDPERDSTRKEKDLQMNSHHQ